MKFIDKVRKDPSILKDYSTPPLDVQIAAIKKDPYAIKYIKNPSNEVQKLAVSIIASAYNFILQPTRDAKIELIKHDPSTIKKIGFDDEGLVVMAISINPGVISVVPNSSFYLQNLAYQKDNSTIFSIKDPHPILIKQHLKIDPKSISKFNCLPTSIQLNHIDECTTSNQLHQRFKDIKNPHVTTQEFYVKSLIGIGLNDNMMAYYINRTSVSNKINDDLKLELFNCIDFSSLSPLEVINLKNIFKGNSELELALTIMA